MDVFMDVFRHIALEIFGLRENFTKEEVNENFKRLSAIVHPDAGGDERLYEFIVCCKEALLNNSKKNYARENASKKESVYVTLNTLYNIYYDLGQYVSEYNITRIVGAVRIFVTPCRNKRYCESATMKLSMPFEMFNELNFAGFAVTIKLPEHLKAFKEFIVRVEFMGKTFEFKLSMDNPFHIVKYEERRQFHSIIELTFEWQKYRINLQ